MTAPELPPAADGPAVAGPVERRVMALDAKLKDRRMGKFIDARERDFRNTLEIHRIATLQRKANLWDAICILFNGGEEKLEMLLHQIQREYTTDQDWRKTAGGMNALRARGKREP